MTSPTVPTTARTHGPRRPRLAAVAGTGILLLALAGCAKGAATTAGGTPGGEGGLSTVAGGAGTSPSPAGSAGTSQGTGTPTPSPAPDSAPAGPKIILFSVTAQPACPVVPSSAAPYSSPGRDITITWKTAGATGVALSIDSPDFFAQYGSGSYASYPAQGSETIAFPCDTSQRNSTHTYTINTLGGGPSVAKTITVSVPSQP